MQILKNSILVIKDVISTSSKLLCIVCCLFFLYNDKSYKLSFNVPQWALDYTFIGTFIHYLNYINILILIVPLSICVTSLLYTESRMLHIISLFMSVSCNIFSLCVGFMRGTLQEFIDFRLFTVYNIIPLEEKKEMFRSFCNIYTSELGSLEKAAYVQKVLNEKYIAIYEKKLANTSLKDVPDYAKKVIEDITIQFEQEHKNIWDFLKENISYDLCLKVVIGSLIIFSAYKLYKYMVGTDITLAKLNKDLANEGEITTNLIKRESTNLQSVLEVSQTQMDVIRNISLKIDKLESTINDNVGIDKSNQELVKDSINKLRLTLIEHEAKIGAITGLIKQSGNTLTIGDSINSKDVADITGNIEKTIGIITEEYDRHFATIDRSIKLINSTLNSNLTEIKKEFDTIQKDLEGLQVLLKGTNTQYGISVSLLDHHTKQINTIEKTVNTHGEHIGALTETTSNIADDITSYHNALADPQLRMDELETRVGSIEERMDSEEKSSKGKLSTMESIGKLKDFITDMNKTLTERMD